MYYDCSLETMTLDWVALFVLLNDQLLVDVLLAVVVAMEMMPSFRLCRVNGNGNAR